MTLKIFSKALYSSWSYHYPTRTVFDAGEGIATALGNEIYGPERICIGHGNHGDHVLGLPSFIGCRNSGRGDKTKPLTVYAPESDSMTGVKEFIAKRNTRLTYPLNFVETKPDLIIPINYRTRIEAFPVLHTYNSFGYKIIETRNRLKLGIAPESAKELKAQGADIYEVYECPVFVWLLDSYSFDLSHIQNAAHVVFDATFLKPEDREGDTHASILEVLKWAKDANVKRVTLAHISTRYKEEDVLAFIASEVFLNKYEFKIDMILGNKVYEL